METLYELLDLLIADAEEMSGIGAHANPALAHAALAEAIQLVGKIERGAANIRKELEDKGYELYLTK